MEGGEMEEETEGGRLGERCCSVAQDTMQGYQGDKLSLQFPSVGEGREKLKEGHRNGGGIEGKGMNGCTKTKIESIEEEIFFV